MISFLNLHPEFFAIDIGDTSLRIVKLQKKRGAVSIVSFNEVSIRPGIVSEGMIKEPDALARLIQTACKTVHGKKLNTAYVVASLPEENSFYQVIQMPHMDEADLKTAVPFEAENYIPLPIDKVYLDYQVIEGKVKHQKHTELLINAMPKPIVDSYVACFEKAGLRPYVLEVESQALVRALLKEGEGQAPVVFLDMGSTKTTCIVYAKNSIRFTASFKFSANELTESLKEGLGISAEKAEKLKVSVGIEKSTNPYLGSHIGELVKEVKRYMGFYRNHLLTKTPEKDSVERIVLCGSGSAIKNLPQVLQKELGVPVEVRAPLSDRLANHKVLSPRVLPAYTTVLGLALRGLRESERYPFVSNR